MTNLQRAQELSQKADKKEKSWGSLGGSSKYEEAAEMYVKAANIFKMEKRMKDAGEAFKNASRCDFKGNSKNDSATNLVNAANALRKEAPKESVECFNQAIKIYTEEGRFLIAAKTAKDIGEILESEENWDMALDAFQKAADFYEGEASPSNVRACLLKVAQISAVQGAYTKAASLFEEIATKSLENNLLKFSAKEYFLRSGFCYLALDDLITAEKAIQRFEIADPGFTQSQQCKLLKVLLGALEKKDTEEFATALFDFDNIFKLDSWKTKVLLKIRKLISPLEELEKSSQVGNSSQDKLCEKEGLG